MESTWVCNASWRSQTSNGAPSHNAKPLSFPKADTRALLCQEMGILPEHPLRCNMPRGALPTENEGSSHRSGGCHLLWVLVPSR